jgi:hypothetical protein
MILEYLVIFLRLSALEVLLRFALQNGWEQQQHMQLKDFAIALRMILLMRFDFVYEHFLFVDKISRYYFLGLFNGKS